MKISEVIKHYSQRPTYDEVEEYFLEQGYPKKKESAEIMLEALGDLDLSEDYIKTFLFILSKYEYGVSYKEKIEKVRVLYELVKDKPYSKAEIMLLARFYNHAVYRLKFDEIKEALDHKDLGFKYFEIEKSAYAFGKEESKKLEELKGVYSDKFIDRLKDIVEKELIPYEYVKKLLPSKKFMDAAVVEVPLGYDINSAEDLIVFRLKRQGFEEEYQKTPLERKINLGICSDGRFVHTSFTKFEYEADLDRKNWSEQMFKMPRARKKPLL